MMIIGVVVKDLCKQKIYREFALSTKRKDLVELGLQPDAQSTTGL